MKRHLLSSVTALALLALNLSLVAGPALAAYSGTVVLDGNYASLLPNGVTSTLVHPIQGTSAVARLGSGAWQSVPGTASAPSKFELYIDPTAAPFSGLGSFKISDIASVSYYTHKPGAATTVDFSLYFYTVPAASGCDSTWYCHRLTAEPMYSNGLNAPASQWNQWNTVAGANQLTFYDGNHTALGFYGGPTLAAIQAGPINWASYPTSGGTVTINYSQETVKYVVLSTGSGWTGFNGNLDAINITLINGNSLTLDLENTAGITISPVGSSVGVGHDVTVNLNIGPVTGLYGYQFQVHYDQAKASATAAFANTFFDTASLNAAFITWNADCTTPGVCKFAVSKQSPAVPSNGSGTVAQITFHGVAPGAVPLTIDNDILSDPNGMPILHTTGSGLVTVFGYAGFSGRVALQGRLTPIDAGSVTLKDAAGEFAPVTVPFDAATGVWSASVPVTPTGSLYNITATHALYLSNQKLGVTTATGGSYAQGATILKGGDANNDGTVAIGDATCVGGNFGTTTTACAGGIADLNRDGAVNILDLVLVGSNYGLASPQGW